jgi:tetratricopeptide (TPR) repeat protein
VVQCSSRLSNRELDATTSQPGSIEPLLLATQSVMVEYALRKQRADAEPAASGNSPPTATEDAETDSPPGMLGIAAAQLLYGCTEGADWLGGAERCVKFLERELGSVENARLLVPAPYAGPILFRWANSLAELGRDQEAVRPLAIAREIARRAGNRPRNIAVCDEALAGISSRIGKPNAAIAIMSRLARQLREAAEPDEAAAGRWDLLRSLVLYRLDRDEEAREIWNTLIKAESASESSRASAAVACLHLGRSLLAESQAADGKAMLERGLALSEGLTGETAISREVFLRPLAGALLELELTEQALATFDDALAAHAAMPESTEGEKLEYRCVRAAFVAATGDTDRAQTEFLAAFDQLLALKPVPGPLVSAAVGQFVGFLVRRGIQSQAQDAVIAALELLSERQVTMAEGESPEMLRLAITHQQAFIDQSSGDTDGAIRLWKQISKRLERLGPRYHPDRLAVERFLADAQNAPANPDDDGDNEFDPDGDRDGGLM